MYSENKYKSFNVELEDNDSSVHLKYTDGDDFLSLVVLGGDNNSAAVHLTPDEMCELQQAVIAAMIAGPMTTKDAIEMDKQYASSLGYDPERDAADKRSA